MKQVTSLEIVVVDGLAVIAIGRDVLIAASAHSLVLYAAGASPGLWIAAGRHRPFRAEAPMLEIIHEAQAWVEELEVATVRRLAS